MANAAKSNRMAALDGWLERINATAMYQVLSPNRRTMITVYAVNGRVFVVMRYMEPRKPASGWDIFVPAHESNHVSLTLDSAAEALGVDGCRGLVEEEATATNT